MDWIISEVCNDGNFMTHRFLPGSNAIFVFSSSTCILHGVVTYYQHCMLFNVLEYCNVETFEASCQSDEVILMTHAQFGQMRVGRCIEEDLGFGYIGCFGDVIGILDATCSGKQTCFIAVASKDMNPSETTCASSLMQYLEADYRCVKGLSFN